MEKWKDIPGYEGLYQASNLGRIRTYPNKTTFTEWHGVRQWTTPQKDRWNYRLISIKWERGINADRID